MTGQMGTLLLLLGGGFVLLIIGGELLVRGAATVAQRLGMSPLLIGLTLVGFGTSTPELVTSVQASLAGSPGIAVGNIVGSNIANVLLILGIAALIAPLAVSQRALLRDGGVGLFSIAVFVVIGWVAMLDRMVGTALVLGLVAYLVYAYRQEMAGGPAGHTAAFEKGEAHDELLDGAARTAATKATAATAVAAPLLMALAGLAIVVGGGKLLVDGATGLARHAGLTETVIGLTIVAVGTSLPELVTSVIAAIRRHGDVALGNVLGSNIYNVLGIGGVTALIAPTSIPEQIVKFDNFVMLAAALLLLIFARSGYRISRLEGLVLISAYAAYTFLIWPW